MENDELAQYLDSLKREDCYRVDEVLKESAHEITQRVFFVGENGAERGPYIRKFIQQESGLGSAYQRVYEAQQNGSRFKHIPDILECYSRDGQLVVIMEYVHGDTLQEVVYQNDSSLALAQHVFPQICNAVSELHTEFDPPIIHRDLKPSNIILTGKDLVLIDFGISREYREQADCDTSHFGTREFAPPEQFGFGQTGVYSDVYSLGMVLYYCLTEQIPSPHARKVAFADPCIPESVRQVIEQACALDPAKRFPSASELQNAFLDAVQSAQTPASSRGGGSAKKWFALGAAAVALMAVVAFGAYTMLTSGGAKPEESKNTQTSSNAGILNATTSSSNGPSGSSAESGSTKGMTSSGQQKGDSNSSSSYSETVAGVALEIPSCFENEKIDSSNGMRSYSADTRSGFSMIRLEEKKIDKGWDDDGNEQLLMNRLSRMKDEFVASVKESGDTLYNKIEYETNYEIAGYTARMVNFSGTVNNTAVFTTMVAFFNPELREVGVISTSQSADAQPDYSTYFPEVLLSAKRAS